ncbi:MAG: YeeE/YedE family protein [Oleiphilaceae bacterium]|nr:YeeE/YedE family protein [Oleiphilaceae bacterium]
MTLDWNAFTPVSALSGGALIGLAAAAFLLLNGRIAGISGILGGLLRSQTGDIGWRIAFLFGLISAPLAWTAAVEAPELTIAANYPMLIIAGLIVGLSTRYGSGCTSGHGVCGISRFSPRSLVATLCFMATGFTTVYVIRHLGDF